MGAPLEEQPALLEPTDLDATFLIEETQRRAAPSDATGKYLSSTGLIGVLIGLALAFILVYALLLMFDLQTPYTFAKESIDWGKIER